MLETILGFIKAMIEKYGMITLLSFIFGIVTVTVVPDDVVNVLPFGEQNIYWALITAIIVWVVIFSSVHSILKNVIGQVSEVGYRKRHRKDNIAELKQMVHESIDGLHEKEREMILEFVTNKNQPITISEHDLRYSIPHIYGREWLNISEKQTAVQTEFIVAATGEKKMGIMYHSHIIKLKEDVYYLLCRIYEEDGRLGHF